MCQSLTKFSGKKLKVLIIESTDYRFFTDLCLERITKLLSYGLEQLTLQKYDISDSAFDELTAAIASSQLKRLNYDSYLTIGKAKSLARLLTQTTTLDEVSVGRCRVLRCWYCGENSFDSEIDVAEILVDALKYSHVRKLYWKDNKLIESIRNLQKSLLAAL